MELKKDVLKNEKYMADFSCRIHFFPKDKYRIYLVCEKNSFHVRTSHRKAISRHKILYTMYPIKLLSRENIFFTNNLISNTQSSIHL